MIGSLRTVARTNTRLAECNPGSALKIHTFVYSFVSAVGT